jgi:phosphohistidine phosphatase
MKTLLICRHAKADYPPHTPDFDRPLKEKGREDALSQAQSLAEQGFCPDLIISSPALRAQQTAEIMADTLQYTKKIQWERRIYEGGVREGLEIVAKIPPAVNSVMLFGHNPILSDMVRTMLNMYNPYEMPTCAMVCVENFLHTWDFSVPQAARLRWVIVPRLKRKGEE